jgi:hypothetical protein
MMPLNHGGTLLDATGGPDASLAPGLGATQVWPGQLPLVKHQLNWTHVERTRRCPCAHAIADVSG